LKQMGWSGSLSLKASMPVKSKSLWNPMNSSWMARLKRSACAFIFGHPGQASQRTAPLPGTVLVKPALNSLPLSGSTRWGLKG